MYRGLLTGVERQAKLLTEKRQLLALQLRVLAVQALEIIGPVLEQGGALGRACHKGGTQ